MAWGLLGVLCGLLLACSKPEPPIKVGVLHSLTGTMSTSETAVRDATLAAIRDVNAHGGVLGRQVVAVAADGSSDPLTFNREMERLITREKVSAVFGCWTSASRRTVRPTVERHNHLLFYPVQYEGMEQSPNIIYLGAAPNQQIIPAVQWCADHVGKRFFLVGSDYVFPRSANAIIKTQVRALGGQVVGEEYLLLGSREAAGVVAKIQAAKPDVILNTINGDGNLAFFTALRAAGITSKDIPTLSFSLAENEIAHFDAGMLAGDYCAWNYFQSVDTKANHAFIEKFRADYGAERTLDDPMEAAWIGVHLWAKAAEETGSADPAQVRRALPGMSMVAPEGYVSVDSTNNHLWKTVRIGRIRADGQFDVVWTSDRPIPPSPYPFFKPRAQWDRELDDLYQGWGHRWANPGGKP